jgi:phosphatidate phosphatase PAH1
MALFVLCPAVIWASEPACPPPVPERGEAGWKHTRTEHFVVALGPAHHRGPDVVVRTGEPQVLIAKFAYGDLDKDLKDETVDIYAQRDVRCSKWAWLGSATTSREEDNGTQQGIMDDGGRVYFTVPGDKQLAVGVHAIRMQVRGDRTVAALNLFVIERETDIVVFDIDGTLTTGDKEITKEVLAGLADTTYIPEEYAKGSDVVNEYARKGYLVVYLTGRPDLLKTQTVHWLVKKGFPAGVVRLTDTLHQIRPKQDGVGKYKRDVLLRLTGQQVNIAAAYGNAETDIWAFAEAGIPKSRTYIIGKYAGKDETLPLTSYTSHLPVIKSLPKAPTPFPGFFWN